jgi:hypothetical protein
MSIAALVAWVLTTAGGFVLLRRWVSRGGLHQQHDGTTRFPAGLVFGHLGAAVLGLIVWVVYLLTDIDRLAWVAFAVLVPVALLGVVMLARWIPARRAVDVGTTAGRDDTVNPGSTPAEMGLPVPVVIAHGVLAAATLVLVLLTALGVGGS